MKTLFAAIGALALAQAAAATEVSVSFSEDFAKDLTKTYGEREGDVLSREITEDVTRAFSKAGVTPARVEVTIVDAKPNRPTFEQLADRPGLDPIRSISLGGMSLVGTAYGSEGQVLTTYEYDWFENRIEDVIGSATWTDANRASRRFATRFAKQIKGS